MAPLDQEPHRKPFTMRGIRQREVEAYDKGKLDWAELRELLNMREAMTPEQLAEIEERLRYGN